MLPVNFRLTCFHLLNPIHPVTLKWLTVLDSKLKIQANLYSTTYDEYAKIDNPIIPQSLKVNGGRLCFLNLQWP